MPKLPADHLDCVFYLFKNEPDARDGVGFGGTGFLVAVSSAVHDLVYLYAVTNTHVAITHSFSTIRVNSLDGAPYVIALAAEDWTPHPDGDDVAVAGPLNLDLTLHRVRAIPLHMFLDQTRISGSGVGVGDAVYMLGRFVSLDDGAQVNAPVARFGHLSAMPYPIKQPTGVVRDTYCVDVHSRSGFSGSPVFVYRTVGDDLEEIYRSKDWRSPHIFVLLLGIHCDQFEEYWPLIPSVKPMSVIGMSGMTKVVPASRIFEIFQLDSLVAKRDELDRDFKPGVSGVDGG